MKLLYIIVVFLFSSLSIYAQSEDSTTDAAKKTQVPVAVTFNSGLNYYGRTDSLKSKGIYPSVGINFKNGLYINSSFVFINNKAATNYAATIVEGGYEFGGSTHKFSGNIFINGFFYKQKTLVQSAVKATSGINLTWLSKAIDFNIGTDGKLSNDIDIDASFGLDHIIRINKVGNGIIVVDPSAYIYTGTQNFSKSYLQQKNVLFLPAGEQLITTNSKKFNILSYEFSMPVVYAIGKMKLIIDPAYTLPQNLITVPGHPEQSETGSNLFYFTTTVKFTF